MSQTKSTEDNWVLKQKQKQKQKQKRKRLNGKKRSTKIQVKKKLRQHHRLTQPYS